jgi:hypothetical protein
MLLRSLSITILSLFMTPVSLAIPQVPADTQTVWQQSDPDRRDQLLAQSQRRSRKKYLTGEARTKGASTEIDFDAAAIEGERRTPTGIAIGSNKADHQYDLINLRLRWHPEMIKSTTHLETGRGR